MEIPTIDVIVPGGSPHSTIQSAVNAAAAAEIGEAAVVWIPPTYVGTDTYTNPSNVPIFDMRGSGSLNFGTTLPFAGVPTGTCMEIQTAVNTLTGDFYSCINGSWLEVGPGLSGLSMDNVPQGSFYTKQDFLPGPFPVLYNGNFEDTNPNQGPSTPARPLNIAGWVGNVNTTLSYEIANVYEGLQSLKVTCASSLGIAAGVTGLYSYPVIQGDTWSIRGAARSDGSIPATLAIQFLDKNSTALPHTNDITASTLLTTWQPLAATGTVPAGAVTAQIFLWNPTLSAAGTMWFDAVEIFRVTNPAGIISPILQTSVFTLTNPATFATLPSSVNGTILYCSDCVSTPTCVGGGTGAIASRLNGVWNCGGNPLSSPITAPNPLAFDVNLAFKGPNPYVDITRYGARAVNPNTTPAAVGLTANTTAGSANVVISSASTFINGDGVVIYGAGAPHSMATPAGLTVTPSLARTGTGTGIVANGPTGATTYNYKIVARDKNGGLTATSPAASTTTGPTSLGAQTVNLTSCTRTNDAFTCITAAAHGFLVGCNSNNPCGEVLIGNGNGLTDITFRGWWSVNSVADTTHFTVTSTYLDTRNGASTSSTGGTATYFNANHLTWSAVTGAWNFYIYSDRASPGTFALIGTSRPQGVTNTDLTFDDFGSPMMDNQAYPPYVPTTPPVSATSDHLSTTIASGAGTTSLTLANTAGTSVTGATARLDACPAILAAATAAGAYNGGIFIPADASLNSFVVNSYCLINKNVAITQSGKLFLNETVEYSPPNTGSKWSGDKNNVQFGTATAAQWQPNTSISVNTANPGVYVDSHGGSYFSGLLFNSANSNGSLELLTEGGFNWAFEKMLFSTTNSGNQDYMGIGLYQRGKAGVGSDTNIIIDQVAFTGGSNTENTSHSPLWFCNDCGNTIVRSAYYLHRGAIYVFDPSGGRLDIQHSYINGGSTPLYTTFSASNNAQVALGTVLLDTISHPCIATFGGPLQVIAGGGCNPSSGVSAFTGFRSPVFNSSTQKGSRDSFAFTPNFNGAQDGIYGTGQLWLNAQFNGGLSTGTTYPIFINGGTPAKPTCTISAGGTLAVGSYTFVIVPVWQNTGEGVGSPTSATCTTTAGNQTVTVNWTAVAGNPLGYDIYTNGVGSSGGGSVMTSTRPMVPASVTSVAISAPLTPFLGPGPAGIAGGPTMLMPGTQGIATPNVITGQFSLAATAFANIGAPVDGTVLYCSDCTLANPCASGGTGALAKRINGAWICN